MEMTQVHINELREAKALLENPSVAARFADVLAGPVEKGMKMLPQGARGTILAAATKSLNVALKAAVLTLGEGEREASNRVHKISAAVSGGVGGAFGLSALAVELPLSTTIMLRSISDIARSEGEDLKSGEAQIACMEVFALGGSSGGDDAAETGIFCGACGAGFGSFRGGDLCGRENGGERKRACSSPAGGAGGDAV